MFFANPKRPTDNLYSIDAPGMPPWYSGPGGLTIMPDKNNAALDYVITDYVLRQHFQEFVRIRTDGRPFNPGNPQAPFEEGSRSSVFFHWHAMMHVHTKQVNGNWVTERFDDPIAIAAGKTENEIAEGLINLDAIGG
jgi:hypothetical protein